LPLALTGEKKDWLSRRAGFCCFATANRILRERKVFVSFKNPWKILANLPADPAPCKGAGEAAEQQHTIWLRTLDEIRTFFKQNPEDFAD
jgi:hypothetical protein